MGQELIDLQKCLTSGQVFRWKRSEVGWIGVDGERAYCLTEDPLPVERVPHSLRRFFRVDWDYQAVLRELTHRGPELEHLLKAAAGLRLLRPSCPRETLFSFLCTSNNHISRITQMVGRLADYGEPIEATGHKRFPLVERIAAVSEDELRAKGFGYRARSIPEVARHILHGGGDAWFDACSRAPYDELIGELIDLPGVGPKLADCIALYAFDKTEATPTDTHLWQAVTRTYFHDWHGTTLTDNKRRAVGEHLRGRFGELAGLAQQLLFFDNLRRNRRQQAVGHQDKI